MSLLIQLRYRIKAIDTIKKITHAMRLISMSSRSRLKSKDEPLREYIQTSKQLLSRIKEHAPDWHNPIINPSLNLPHNPLVILIGSQRGLCGNFNTTLFHFLERTIAQPIDKSGRIPIIPIGKKAINYIDDKPLFEVITQFPELNAKTIGIIAQQLTQLLFNTESKFTNVSVFSNKLKTFFIQKPHETIIVPFTQEGTHKTAKTDHKEEYYWEQSPNELLNQLTYQTVEAQIQYLLFQSLLAEHAARFISMDNATRNAQTLLEETQLQYNKLRQAKITKELTELVSSM